jgi:hypothetical protein
MEIMVTLIAIWSGIAILMGSRIIGGFLAASHALIMILLTNNVWTPKVDPQP